MVARSTAFVVDLLLQYVVFFGKFWSEALEKITWQILSLKYLSSIKILCCWFILERAHICIYTGKKDFNPHRGQFLK